MNTGSDKKPMVEELNTKDKEKEKNQRSLILNRIATANEILDSELDIFKELIKIHKKLGKVIDNINISEVSKFGCTFNAENDTDFGYLDKQIKRKICLAYDESEIQSRYTIKIDRIYEETEKSYDPFGMGKLFSTLDLRSRKKTKKVLQTNYVLEKNSDEPNSVTILSSAENKISPNCKIWFILIPGITRISLCYGYEIFYNDINFEKYSFNVKPFIVSNDVEIFEKKISNDIQKLIDMSFLNKVESLISKRMDYIEYENKDLMLSN